MKRKYTEAVHSKRVKKVIEKKNPCGCCPAQPQYRAHTIDGFAAWESHADVCAICKRFVGLKLLDNCPCGELGKEEAIKRTWLALEEKGYLD